MPLTFKVEPWGEKKGFVGFSLLFCTKKKYRVKLPEFLGTGRHPTPKLGGVDSLKLLGFLLQIGGTKKLFERVGPYPPPLGPRGGGGGGPKGQGVVCEVITKKLGVPLCGVSPGVFFGVGGNRPIKEPKK